MLINFNIDFNIMLIVRIDDKLIGKWLIKALLCNILPPHVAAHFLSAQRQIRQQQQQGEQLYSQSYTDVGVLFASIPNFSGTQLHRIHSTQR